MHLSFGFRWRRLGWNLSLEASGPKTLERMVHETLQQYDLDERLHKAAQSADETQDYRIDVLPSFEPVFNIPYQDTPFPLNFLGPYGAVPPGMVIDPATDRKTIFEATKDKRQGYLQNQLIVLPNGVYLRSLQLDGVAKKTHVRTDALTYFGHGPLAPRRSHKNEYLKKLWYAHLNEIARTYLGGRKNDGLGLADSNVVVCDSEDTRQTVRRIFELLP